MPAVWTDDNDEVERIHHRPEQSNVDTSEAYLVDDVPTVGGSDRKSESLYYTPTDGFWTESTDPLAGAISLSDSQKEELYHAVNRSDWDTIITIIENT